MFVKTLTKKIRTTYLRQIYKKIIITTKYKKKMKEKFLRLKYLNTLSRNWYFEDKINTRIRYFQMIRLLKMYNNLNK